MDTNTLKLLFMERLLEEIVTEDSYSILIQSDLRDALMCLSYGLCRLQEEEVAHLVEEKEEENN